MIELELPNDSSPAVPSPPTLPSELQPATLKAHRDWFSLVLVFLLGAFVAYIASQTPSDKHEDKQEDGQHQVEPDKHEDNHADKKSDRTTRIEAAGAVFVFVYEFQTKTVEQELLLRDMKAWCDIHKCQFRAWDQDSDEAKPYKAAAEKAGHVAPFLAVVRDKSIKYVFDFPRDRAALDRLVK